MADKKSPLKKETRKHELALVLEEMRKLDQE